MVVYRIHDLEVDTTSRRVRRAGSILDVSGLNFDVLQALIEAGAEPVNGDALAANAWGQTFVSDETIAKRIALLREALGDEARAPRYVRTVRGKGYALATPPVALDEVDASVEPGRSWLLPAGFGLSVATIFTFIFAALLRADYSVTMVVGATGHVDHTIERDWAGAAPIDLVDPVTGDVLIQSQTTPEVREDHALYLLELAEPAL